MLFFCAPVSSPDFFRATFISEVRLDVNCIQTVLEKSVLVLLIVVSFHSFQAHAHQPGALANKRLPHFLILAIPLTAKKTFKWGLT
jgi:hypothetical protein